MVCADFKNKLEVYGTGDLGRVVAAMNTKALVAGGVLLRRAKAESDKRLEAAAEHLHLTVENEKLKKEIAVLQALDDLRKNRTKSWRRGRDAMILLFLKCRKNWIRRRPPLRT